jgi:hypothetical protein
MILQIVEYKDGWGYRFKNKGRILVHSEPYDSRPNAERAAKNFEIEIFEAIQKNELEVEYITMEETDA